jgi:hypothetical protein
MIGENFPSPFIALGKGERPLIEWWEKKPALMGAFGCRSASRTYLKAKREEKEGRERRKEGTKGREERKGRNKREKRKGEKRIGKGREKRTGEK